MRGCGEPWLSTSGSDAAHRKRRVANTCLKILKAFENPANI